MKSICELTEKKWMESPSNNWLKVHGFAMSRNCGKRKRLTERQKKELEDLPFK